MNPRSLRLLCAGLVWTASLVGGATASAEEGEPWRALGEVRAKLAAAGPRAADFEQTYLPAGFKQGESESGRLALSLPDCLRWDYAAPDAKSFLVCGSVAHYWNDGEATGKRQRIDGKNEPGLDLLLLGVEELKRRYRASLRDVGQGQVQIDLEPLRELPECKRATLTLDRAGGVVSGLEYEDQEGNRTRFTLSRYGPLSNTDLFEPPAKMVWEAVEEP